MCVTDGAGIAGEPNWEAEFDVPTRLIPSGGVTTALSVRDAIATLPARQREAVVLRYLADLPARRRRRGDGLRGRHR